MHLYGVLQMVYVNQTRTGAKVNVNMYFTVLTADTVCVQKIKERDWSSPESRAVWNITVTITEARKLCKSTLTFIVVFILSGYVCLLARRS